MPCPDTLIYYTTNSNLQGTANVPELELENNRVIDECLSQTLGQSGKYTAEKMKFSIKDFFSDKSEIKSFSEISLS